MHMENKYSKKYIISTGLGLQDVDKLSNSKYFLAESQRYINGEISLDELDDIITSYYNNKPDVEDRSEEADKVALRISKLISDDAFSFTVGQLLSIHSYLFNGIIKNAGKLREYNFSKPEWVLDNDSVTYGDYRQLKETLDYDFGVEKNFSYRNLSTDEIIDHLSIFISNLWQIHAFEEGNTRTTAVFIIKYLRSLGFDITNDEFAKNAWYFRNALVRANYTNISKGIFEDRSFLVLFLRNLLLGEKNKLENKTLHVNNSLPAPESKETRIVRIMEDNPSVTLNEIAKELGVSLRTVKSLVSTLQTERIIERQNGKRYASWIIVRK